MEFSFPSKEDAVLGHIDDDIPADVLEEFIAGGHASPAICVQLFVFGASPGLICRPDPQRT
ncbi:hypothetical protein [Pseudarthrobacter oxydans]|uniref:hypothetical protein n=1 Tax=Pseudarthrobacter oxydans TaxID=1671 RepID=UPI003811BEE1